MPYGHGHGGAACRSTGVGVPALPLRPTCSIASFRRQRRIGSGGNAVMERFFKSLKTERTDRKVYRSRAAAKADVFDYIERFYNARHRHSTLG